MKEMERADTSPILWIVVPCCNEQEVLPGTITRLTDLLGELKRRSQVAAASRLLLVDDGSTDGTWAVISQSSAALAGEVAGIRLTCNSGHQNALLAGLGLAVDHADVTITIDADLQDDIGVIGNMLDCYRAGSEIVYGVRRDRRSDSWFKRTSASLFYKFMRSLGVNTVANHADFRLMSRRAVQALLGYRERNIFLRGIVTNLSRDNACVYYDRAPRTAGETKYTLPRMINFAVDGISSFSVKPLRIVFVMGLAALLVALLIFIYALWSYFSGRVVTGWTSLILSLWAVGAFVLLGMGVIGEYVGRIYIEVKNRPRYQVEDTVGLPEKHPSHDL